MTSIDKNVESEFRVRYPELDEIFNVKDLWKILDSDADTEMGNPTQWRSTTIFRRAKCALIAHHAYKYLRTSDGDGSAMLPMRAKEADGVSVEYTATRHDEFNYFDPYNATVYGQEYVQLRHKAFGGVRMI